MNQHQTDYRTGKFATDFYPHIAIGGAAANAVFAAGLFGINGMLSIPFAALGGYALLRGSQVTLARYLLHKYIRELKPGEQPAQYAERIDIADQRGLDHLLEKTRYGEKREWGTAFDADYSGKNAVIDRIMDSTEAGNMGLWKAIGRACIVFNFEKMRNHRIGGFHHFHPSQEATNYSISDVDRCADPDFLQLLTFNMPQGPELIGYNFRHTYLPADDTKRTLVRADHRDIMEYLGRL